MEALIFTILEQLDPIDDFVDKAMLKTNLQDVQSFVRAAETRQVKEKSVRDWLDKLRDTIYDIEDLLDEWITMIRKLGRATKVRSHLSCHRGFVLPPYIGKINHLCRTLEAVAIEKDKWGFSKTKDLEPPMPISTANLPELKIQERDQDKNELLKFVLSKTRSGPTFPIISVAGMRGSGKTILARQVFNNYEVNTHFQKKIWICVSDIRNEINITKEILKYLNVKTPNLDDLETFFVEIRQSLRGVKFLLVLDDVCIEDSEIWDEMRILLKNNCQGSKILITIREENNTKMLGTTNLISLEKISNKECMSLINQVAKFPRTNDEGNDEYLQEFVCKCNGLAVNLSSLASLLRSRTAEEWQAILRSELWELEDAERGIFPSFFLSYYDLPTILRKCFSCCAMFPKNFKLEKDTLIKLWMAQGYLKETEMEKVGEEYFQTLALRSFFYDFERSKHNNKIINCRMPDKIHDLAQTLAKEECCIIEVNGPEVFQFKSSYNQFPAKDEYCIVEVNDPKEFQLKSSYKKVRHLKITEISYSDSLSKREILCRLVKCGFSSKVGLDLSKLLDRLTCLRTLDLSGCSIEEFPRSRIKSLIHLRYLNLSHNKVIKELPDMLCELYNLRTLDISNCESLQNLPHGIGKLSNLLHLINYGTPIRYLPKEVDKLKCIRTLNKFVISDEKDDKRACKLQYLANLKNLQGFLIITGLGNVSHENEVNNAKLSEKESLVGLALRFDGLTHVVDEVIFEGLNPPPNLEELMVQYYIGKTMCLNPLMPLKELKVLKLSFCLEFEHLPPVGQLPFLVSLYISNMKNVKSVSKEFLGKEKDGTETFPKLRILKFKHMDAWAIWKDMKVLSCLHQLTIRNCQKLEALPVNILQSPKLQNVDISKCSLLNEHFNKKTEEDWSKIFDIQCIKIDGKNVKGDDN